MDRRSANSTDEAQHSLWPAVRLGLGVAVGNGFARFAYALLLPAMRDDLKWNYTEAGWMNTANALGYIVGAVSGYILLRRLRPTQLFVSGLVFTVIALLVTGLRSDLAWLALLRLLSGVGAAWAFSCGAALVSAHFQASPGLRGTATGIYFAGGGVGIAASGFLIDPVLAYEGSKGWPIAWAVLGVSAGVASVWPVWQALQIRSTADLSAGAPLDLRGLHRSILAYFLFAAGYIVYMTFIFAWIRSQHMSQAFGMLAWVLLGAAVTGSPFVWKRALDRWNPAVTLAASCAITLAGTLVLIATASPLAILISAVLFGLGVFIAPASVTVLTRRAMPATQWAKTITLFTVVFSVGQAIGPVFAGVVADRYSLTGSLYFTAGLLFAASLAALFRRSEAAARIA